MKHENLRVKVCGMRPGPNLDAVVKLRPDFVGFIFVPTSSRFVDSSLVATAISTLPNETKALGVFLDLPLEEISTVIQRVRLCGVQLHGNESSAYCKELRNRFPNLTIFKAVPISESTDFSKFEEFDVDALLFDTAGATSRGGTGKTFDWNLLRKYRGNIPFILAGGIGAHNIESALSICSELPLFHGVDINSAVEDEPGVKNIKLVADVIRRIRNG